MNDLRNLDLSDDDYDALYAVLRAHLPTLTRSEFPATLARVVARGFVSVMSRDDELLVLLGAAPKHKVFPIRRKRTLH